MDSHSPMFREFHLGITAPSKIFYIRSGASANINNVGIVLTTITKHLTKQIDNKPLHSLR